MAKKVTTGAMKKRLHDRAVDEYKLVSEYTGFRRRNKRNNPQIHTDRKARELTPICEFMI